MKIFKIKKHNSVLYNILLKLARNIFFYKKIQLHDTYETRVYLMFFHFSIIMFLTKKAGKKYSQDEYDNLFFNMENNLREIGFGDISVNKKMKDLNKILYDILLKLQPSVNKEKKINFNYDLISKYFKIFKDKSDPKYIEFEDYFSEFYNYCTKLPLENMTKQAINFNYNYGCT